MYAMYFKQPTKDFCKFRFTLMDWKKMKIFYDAISIEPKYLQARTIFWRLWQSNAFRFVECDTEHYPELMHLHQLANDGRGDFLKINTTILGRVKDLQNESKGLLSAIETLQLGYNEMKEHFATNINECAHMQSINVIDGVTSQLDKIKKLFESKYDGKSTNRKSRDATRAGPSKAVKNYATTDYDTEFNVSRSTCSESNDEQNSTSERSDDEAMDECLNIGTKRYYLKRKALQRDTGKLHRFRSCVIETESSPNKKKAIKPIPLEADETEELAKSMSAIQQNESHASIDNTSENIVIVHPKKVYNRHSKRYISTARKQVTDCPW